MKIDELLVGLGFDYDPEGLEKFKADVSKTVNTVRQLARAALAASAAVGALVATSSAASAEQARLADEIGDTVENIDALHFATRRAGGSADAMNNSLRQLSVRAAEASRGLQSGAEPFGLLDIEVYGPNGRLKRASDLMLEISSRFQSFSKSEQIELADKLGIRDSIRLLQQGPKAIRELVNEAKALGVTTKADTVVSLEFQESLVDIWQIMKQVSRTITRALLPFTNKLINDFTEWWKINRQIIEQNLPRWIEQLAAALKLLGVAIAAFIGLRLISHLVALITLMRGLTIATLAFNLSLIALPALLAIIAGVIAGLIQDARLYFEGGNTLFGDMIEKFPQFKEELELVAALFRAMGETTNIIARGWKIIFELFAKAKEVFGGIGEYLPDVSSISSALKLDTEGSGRAAGDLLMHATPGLGPLKGITNIIDLIKIEVTGSSNPEATAEAVFNKFQQTSQDLDSAVDQ